MAEPQPLALELRRARGKPPCIPGIDDHQRAVQAKGPFHGLVARVCEHVGSGQRRPEIQKLVFAGGDRAGADVGPAGPGAVEPDLMGLGKIVVQSGSRMVLPVSAISVRGGKKLAQ